MSIGKFSFYIYIVYIINIIYTVQTYKIIPLVHNNELLSNFKIDTHIEVILIGEEFDSKSVQDLNGYLDFTSTKSVKSFPLNYIKEKLIFHVSLAKVIEKDIKKLFNSQSNSIKIKSDLENIFNNYQKIGSLSTTLFILRLNSNPESHQTFLSQSGFACLDLSNQLTNYNDDNDIIDIINKDILENKLNLFTLANIIHRSGEYLFPYPLPIDLYNNVNHKTNNIKKISIVLFTICLDENKNSCESDSNAIQIVNHIVDEYSSSLINIEMKSLTYNIYDNSQLLMSYQSSLRCTGELPHLSHRECKTMVNSEDLLYWLASTLVVRNEILNIYNNDDITTVIPVFILKTSQTEFFIDDNKYSTSIKFSDNLFNLKRNKVPSDLPTWPDTAVVVLSLNSLKTTSITNYLSNLYNNIFYSIWKISSDIDQYSSPISKSIVNDYLWENIDKSLNLSIKDFKLNGSFQKKRISSISHLFKRIMNALNKYDSLIQTSKELVPPLPYELSSNIIDSNYKNNTKNLRSPPSSSMKLFNDLFQSFGQISSSISHFEFDTANNLIIALDSTIAKIITEIKSIVLSSNGNIICSFVEDNNIEDNEKKKSSEYSNRSIFVIFGIILGFFFNYISFYSSLIFK
jgi:hypothetical protein